jgi:hypothetical protein
MILIRGCWWDLPKTPVDSFFSRIVVGGKQIVVFSDAGIYSLTLKPIVDPPTATVLFHTKKLYESMLFLPDFSDVTFVCPDGAEIWLFQSLLSRSLARTTPWTGDGSLKSLPMFRKPCFHLFILVKLLLMGTFHCSWIYWKSGMNFRWMMTFCEFAKPNVLRVSVLRM